MKLSFLILFVLVILLTPGVPSGNAATDDKNKVEKRQGPQAPEVARTTELKSEFSLEKTIKDFIDSEKGRHEQERADEKRWWPPTPSWAIVYATFLYILVAVGQLCAIYYQATIAKRAITHFERPWVRIDPKDPTLPNKELGFGTMIPWTATNVGKSPAFVTRLFERGSSPLLKGGQVRSWLFCSSSSILRALRAVLLSTPTLAFTLKHAELTDEVFSNPSTLPISLCLWPAWGKDTGSGVFIYPAEKPSVHPSRASGRTEEQLKSLEIFRSC